MTTLILAILAFIFALLPKVSAMRFAIYPLLVMSPALAILPGSPLVAGLGIIAAEVTHHYASKSSYKAPKAILALIAAFFSCLLLIHILLELWHPHTSSLVESVGGIVIGLTAVLLFTTTMRAGLLPVKAIILTMLTVHIMGLALLAISPSLAVTGGRFSGLFSNPNTTGAFALSIIVIALVRQVQFSLWLSATLIGFTSLVLSGSRAATIASVFVVLMVVGLRGGWGKRSALLLLAMPILLLIMLPGSLIMRAFSRTVNTRSSWEDVTFILTYGGPKGAGAAPIDRGYDLLSVESYLGSSPGTAAYWIGPAGLVLVAFMMILLILIGARGTLLSLTFAVALCVHAIFESWMTSGANQLMMLFFLTLGLVAWSDLPKQSAVISRVPAPNSRQTNLLTRRGLLGQQAGT